ncbi:ABC transporter permease [Aggregicoccus sp. 17bor-14]|uniref:ABC transporter permease n=1 Tax=Myxococcaceae TaxID=31 RepID=UPI00129D097A|nr:MULTISPECIES: ABC transporter permease [Myxococcaceae]MBF5041606.1 ABC transporter permease [Simulacricoccus sp. 17bor-14]MRI87391.1 ABC transporter permease [Aggregicoccus sp. 17bor-14]
MRSSMKHALLRTGAIAAKEALHIRRDPRMLYLALGMPVLMLLLFGYGVSFDLDHIALAWVDPAPTASSRQLARAFQGSGEFELQPVDSVDEVQRRMRRGALYGAVVVPRDFEERLLERKTAPVQLLVEGSDAVSANQVLSKADAVVRNASRELTGAPRMTPPVQVRVWTLYNPEARSALFMVPGLAAYLLAICAVLLTALTIAGEWERGSMEQLFASPVGRLEIVLGKLVPYLVLGMLQLLLVLAFGATAFDVPLRGSLPLLFVAGLLFLVGMLGQGLLISVVAKNQLVATQAGALSALLPSMLLSGMIFPVQNMPLPLRLLSQVIPARHLVYVLRGVLLKGNGFATLWPSLLALAAFAVAVIALATRRFERRVA